MRRSLTLIVLLALLAGLAPTSSPSIAADRGAPIRLQVVTFWPGLGEQPDIPPGLTTAEPSPGQDGYYLVQFAGPIRPGWKQALADLGAEIVAYIPEFAFKVRMTPGQAQQATRLENIAWVGVFQPAYKLSPNLLQDGKRLYTVRVERGAQIDGTVTAVASTGAQVLSRGGNIVRVLADEGQLAAIAHVLDVAWIENFALPELHNEYGAGVIMGANTANALGYDGSSQTAAVADTGLGDGTKAGAHPDIPASRITAIHAWTAPDWPDCRDVIPDGALDPDSGHGTHVALSVLGDGQTGGKGQGTAPAAQLVFQAVEDYVDYYGACEGLRPDGYYLCGLPDDLGELFQQAYDDGARIHSNSWGHAAQGAYDTSSASVDDFVWNHPDMTVLFSAGNEATDGDGNGYVDLDSMNSPATAKNIISIGASENDRNDDYECDRNLKYTDGGTSCKDQNGKNTIFKYGDWWPADFPANPIRGDESAGNTEQLAAFSSRGPTDDGRIKPDVVAPGTWVLSGYSDLYQRGYDGSRNPQNNAWQYDGWGFPGNAEYKYMGGTSMAAPLAAGGATVVRDYYHKAHSHAASAALVKATLINSTVDLLDENNDGQNDNDYPIPNNHEGWGRVDLAAATDGSHQYVDETTGLGTGSDAVYNYAVSSSGAPFKVSLVWSDYPSTETAAKNLVNDLDLVVTGPGSTVYRGNHFANGWSQTGGSADRTNNVENVYVQAPAAGAWTVEVSGHNVPMGAQPYALVVDGASTGNQPPVATFTYSCSGQDCAFDASGSSDPDGTIASYDWAFGDGGSGSGVSPSHAYAAGGTYTVVLTVTDNDGATGTDSQQVTTGQAAIYLPLVAKRHSPLPDAPVLNPISNPDGDGNYMVTWNPAQHAASYTLQEDDNASFASPTTRYNGSSTSWNTTGQAAGTYYYRLKASYAWGDSTWSNVEAVTVGTPTGPEPGHYTGVPGVSFDVTADGQVCNFQITVPFLTTTCRLQASECLPIVNNAFAWVDTDPWLQQYQNSITGRFDTRSHAVGDYSIHFCENQLIFTPSVGTWEAGK